MTHYLKDAAPKPLSVKFDTPLESQVFSSLVTCRLATLEDITTRFGVTERVAKDVVESLCSKGFLKEIPGPKLEKLLTASF